MFTWKECLAYQHDAPASDYSLVSTHFCEPHENVSGRPLRSSLLCGKWRSFHRFYRREAKSAEMAKLPIILSCVDTSE